MPAVRRAAMVPRPWAGPPWRRLWNAQPAAAWPSRQGGLRWRRLLLLLLILLPTAMGARFMLDVLPAGCH